MDARKTKDRLLAIPTYFSAIISAVVLFGILLFIFIKGAGYLSFKMITNDYYESPYFLTCTSDREFNLQNGDDVYYSKVWGIGLKDDYDLEGNECVKIVYIDNLSPLRNAKDQNTNTDIEIKEGQIIKRVQIVTDSGLEILSPKLKSKALAQGLDKGNVINELYYVTIGGGIRGSLVSTIYLILLTLVISMPIGIIAAIYLANYAKDNKLTKIIRSLIDMIAGVPSIIFGLMGVIVFIPFVSGITKTNGGSILSGALTMSVMLLPTIIKNTEEAIYTIPKGYKMSSLALGASETETTFKIIIPNAIPGILTSVILSIGRIIGESAALIFAIGTAIQDDISIFKSSTTLAVHIWSVMSGENPNYAMACAISIIILVMVLILNILVKLVCKKLNRFEVK